MNENMSYIYIYTHTKSAFSTNPFNASFLVFARKNFQTTMKAVKKPFYLFPNIG
jgi:hypothetical protein